MAKRKVHMKETYTPVGSFRTLYAGSTYPLDPEVAKEVVDEKGVGEYPASASRTGSTLEEKNVADLRDKAKALGIEGYSQMNKADLVDAIEKKEAEAS